MLCNASLFTLIAGFHKYNILIAYLKGLITETPAKPTKTIISYVSFFHERSLLQFN